MLKSRRLGAKQIARRRRRPFNGRRLYVDAFWLLAVARNCDEKRV